jgi:hypothetical protein
VSPDPGNIQAGVSALSASGKQPTEAAQHPGSQHMLQPSQFGKAAAPEAAEGGEAAGGLAEVAEVAAL